MARNSFNINIILKGFEKANSNLKKTTSSINKLGTETKKTKTSTDKYKEANKKLKAELEKLKKQFDRTRISTAGLRRQIGAIRNNFLLVSFAVGGVLFQLKKFVDASAGFQNVKARLVGLTGGVEQAEEAFNVFNKVAASTPFQLQDVVNAGAQLEAFGVNSKTTLRSVTDLASFMGTSATDAANALGRAFAGGAGAADILREKGILNIIKDFKGIENITDLTLPQFRQALMEAMIDPALGIEGSSERMSQTFSGAVSNMKDAFNEFAAAIGDVILDDLTKLVKGIEKVTRAMDAQRVAQFATALGIVGAGFVLIRAKAILAGITLAKITSALVILSGHWKKAAILLGIVFTDAVLRHIDAFSNLAKKMSDVDDETAKGIMTMEEYAEQLGNLDESLKAAKDAEEELREAIEGSEESFLQKIRNLEAERAALQGLSMEEQEKLRQGRDLSNLEKSRIKIIEKLTREIKELKKAQKDLKDEEKEANKDKEDLLKLEEKMRKSLVQIKNESLILQAKLDGADDREIEKMELKDELFRKIITDTGASVEQYEKLNEKLLENTSLEELSNLALKGSLELTPEYIDALVSLYQLKDQVSESTTGLSQEEQNLINLERQLTVALMEQRVVFQEIAGAKSEDIKQSNLHIKLWSELAAATDGAGVAFDNLSGSMAKNKNEFFEWLISMEGNRRAALEFADNNEALATTILKLATNLRTGIMQIDHATNGLQAMESQSRAVASGILAAAGAMKVFADNTATGEQKAAAFLRTVGGILMMFPGGQIPGAIMQGGAMFVGHTGGLVKNDGIQRFAQGGMVRGQDNVPIMAQAGEFIVRREAVQNIGVQNLAEMNQTGSTAPSITVNVQGNMVGNESFVRETLIPEIARAQKLNLA